MLLIDNANGISTYLTNTRLRNVPLNDLDVGDLQSTLSVTDHHLSFLGLYKLKPDLFLYLTLTDHVDQAISLEAAFKPLLANATHLINGITTLYSSPPLKQAITFENYNMR